MKNLIFAVLLFTSGTFANAFSSVYYQGVGSDRGMLIMNCGFQKNEANQAICTIHLTPENGDIKQEGLSLLASCLESDLVERSITLKPYTLDNNGSLINIEPAPLVAKLCAGVPNEL